MSKFIIPRRTALEDILSMFGKLKTKNKEYSYIPGWFETTDTEIIFHHMNDLPEDYWEYKNKELCFRDNIWTIEEYWSDDCETKLISKKEITIKEVKELI